MAQAATLRVTTALLRRRLRRIPRVKVDVESPRTAYFQTILSRGDRRIGTFLEAVHETDGDWWAVIRRWQRDGRDNLPHPDSYVYRTYGETELLPWDHIDQRVTKDFLRVERRGALQARQTPPCDTTTCTSCAAC